MWLKIVILVLLNAIVVSLFSGTFFLRDAGSGRQLFSALALRISLTVVVMLLIAWELWSGQLQWGRSEEHSSELQSRTHLVCRLLLEKKKNKDTLQFKFMISRSITQSLSVIHLHSNVVAFH